MLTISQLANYAGVTVRAVRHYHAKGLLPEPERDHSGYRRYGAADVVTLIRIRILAEAGVPLARVQELLAANADNFAAAVADIDSRLQAEIRARQRSRRRIAQLAAGDSLALPPDAVAYLERLRELGISQRAIDIERDAWILVAAQLPEQMPQLMALKRAQIDNPAVIEIYRDLVEAADWSADDPRLPAVADRLVTLIEETMSDWEGYGSQGDFDFDDELVELLDSIFVDSVPAAPTLLRLLEQRGWTGWTKLERIDATAGSRRKHPLPKA